MSSDSTSADELHRNRRASAATGSSRQAAAEGPTDDRQPPVTGQDQLELDSTPRSEPAAPPTPKSTGSRGRTSRPAPQKRASSTPAITRGDELEMRLARVWFWEGSFTRRGINLQQHFTDENFTITDLDLLALEVTGQLTLRRGIGEAKSGTGKDAPKPMDRCLWLAGVSQLVDAQTADYVTAANVSRKVREIAARLGVRPTSMNDLSQRENAVRIGEVLDVGSHGPTAMIKAKTAQKHARNERQWERAFWFVRCEVWFLEPWHAIKRCIGLLDSLTNWWTPEIDDDDQAMLRWLYAEALGIFALNAVVLAGLRLASEKNDWRAWAADRLAEGAVPMHQMKVLSSAIDKYTAGLLGRLGAPAQVHTEAMGTFLPSPPEWTDSLLELIERLAANPLTARHLPRHVDLVVYERLVHRRHIVPQVLSRVDGVQGSDLDKMRRQLTAFLRGNARLPETVDKALATTTTPAPVKGTSPTAAPAATIE